MFSSVHWSEYLTYLLIATITYYLFVWIVFYKAKLSLLPGLSRIPSSMYGEDSPDEVITTAQYVIDELRPLFCEGIKVTSYCSPFSSHSANTTTGMNRDSGTPSINTSPASVEYNSSSISFRDELCATLNALNQIYLSNIFY